MGIGAWFGFGSKEPVPVEPVHHVPTSQDLLDAVDRVEQQARDGKAPGMVQSRLGRVARTVRDTVPRLDTLGQGSVQAYNVMATATNYLPDAIGGYLRLPRQWADSRPVDRGKTPLMILIDQLDLLGATMDKVFDAVCRADAEALVIHGRFLEEKFGGAAGGGDLRIGATPLPPQPGTTPATPGSPSPLTPPPGEDELMTALEKALDELAVVARRLGVDAHEARREGVALAATVAEPAQPTYRAAQDWARATGMANADDIAAANTAFVNSASSGRKWRASPTTLVSHLRATGTGAGEYADALASVVEAAATLAGSNAAVTQNVIGASQAQRMGAVAPLSTGPFTPGPFSPNGTGPLPQPGDPADPPAYDASLSPLRDPRIQESLRLIGALGGGPQPSDPTVTPGVPAAPTPPTPQSPASDAAAPQTEAATEAATAAAAAPEEPPRSVEELLADLDAMIGLGRVKREVHQQVAMLKVEQKRKAAGMRNPNVTRHLVFVGNPGTGKTTVARMVAGIYKALGLLTGGQLVEVDRSELVAGYLGQTAIKTAEVCTKAAGGVLFIDEAYSLGGDQYGNEAINTLVKEMEDRRDDLVVIVAGYTEPMIAFIAANPGLASRFKTTVEFADYSDDELVAILRKLADAADYDVSREAEMTVRGILAGTARTLAFGNGRYARNLLEEAIGRHAWRLQDVEDPSIEQLRSLLPEDFRALADDADDPEAGAGEPQDPPQSSEGSDVGDTGDDDTSRQPATAEGAP